jgi:hypothetical protein
MNDAAGSSTFLDVGPHAFSGSYVAGTSPGVAGPCFDGKTGCQVTAVAAGTLPTATLTGGPTSAVSLFFWHNTLYNPQNNSTNSFPIFVSLGSNTSIANSSIACGGYSGTSGGDLVFELVTSAGTSSNAASLVVPVYGWHFYALTWSGATFTWYIDGQLLGSAANAGTFTAPTKLFFGNLTGGSANDEDYGNIAKISATSTALTQAQINAIYNVGRFGHV